MKQLDRGFHSSYFATMPVNALNLWLFIMIYCQLKDYMYQQKMAKKLENWEIINRFLNDKEEIETSEYSKICQSHFLPIFLHYFILITVINLWANLEILMRVVSTHPVYHWSYAYLMANKNRTRLETIVVILLLVHHSVFMIFEFTTFPLNVGTP